jgi:transcriptional regulator with XRE-family HTH domain
MNDRFIIMAHSGTAGNTRERLAANLRRLRIANHLSLSQLARATSTSKATLSGIESGRGNPTVDTLTVLADALGVSISELLETASVGEVRIVRVADTRPWPPDGAARRLLERAGGPGGALEIVELALPPGHLDERKARAGGSRDGVLVLQGKLIAGPRERISELTAGDYSSFPADVTHVYESGRVWARALVIQYTPGRSNDPA